MLDTVNINEKELKEIKEPIEKIGKDKRIWCEEYYGPAQSKIEEALTLAHDVDLALIQYPAFVERFTATLAALAQESGRILVESSIIAEEDPMAWLEDVDIEQS